jgi:hypothetical protein
MSMSKLALIAALAAVSMASPAFAQSLSRDGSMLPHYFESSGALVWGSWGPPQASVVHPIVQAHANVNHRVARSTRDLYMSGASGRLDRDPRIPIQTVWHHRRQLSPL